MNFPKVIRELISHSVTAVHFIADYFGLAFDNGIAMSILVWPSLIYEGRTISADTEQYRSLLSSLKGLLVTNAMGQEDFLYLEFENSLSLRIPLDTDTPSGEHIIINTPERVTIVG
jgi:hypothetical protein